MVSPSRLRPRKHRPGHHEVDASRDLLAVYLRRQARLKAAGGEEDVPACDYDLRPLDEDHPRWSCIRDWVNAVRQRKIFRFLGLRKQRRLPKGVGDKSLWREHAFIYLELFEYAKKQFKSGQAKLPDLEDMIFRDPRHFRAGSWSKELDIWLPLIQQMPAELRDELYESIHQGVDLLSFTERVHPKNARPRGGRSKSEYYSVAVEDAEYVRRQVGRHPDKLEHAARLASTAGDDEPSVHPAGYRPVILGEGEEFFEEPNQRYVPCNLTELNSLIQFSVF